MVKSKHAMQAVCVPLMLSPLGFGDSSIALAHPGIESLRVVSESPARIKPCEPLFVILDVTVPGFLDESEIRKVVHDLRRATIVTDKKSGVRLHDPEVYPAAVVFLNEWSIRAGADDKKSFQAVALLYWNAEVEDYLFGRPGVYQIAFDPQLALEVTVEHPTKAEQDIIRKMMKIGEASTAFFIGSIDGAAKGLGSVIEGMLEQFPDTAYTPYLSMSLGLSKIRDVRYGPGIDPKGVLSERVRLASKYLVPYCTSAMKSPLQAAAAVRLAEIRLAQSRAKREGDSERAATFRREAKALLERVKDSPYSVDMRSKAAHKLHDLAAIESNVDGDMGP